jgi:lipid A 3-O-deacylase
MTTDLIYLFLLMIFSTSFGTDIAYAEDKPRYLSLISENDIYSPNAQDRHYSNGLRLGFSVHTNNKNLRIIDSLLDNNLSTKFRNESALGHNIYTPENFISKDLQENDRPFAGWLYGEFTRIANTPNTEKAISLSLGIIGPAALGNQIQTFNHTIINDPKPLGWDNQLKNEPAILVKYRWSKFSSLINSEKISIGLISRLGLNLGNVFTDAGGGLLLRAGSYLPNHEIPLRIESGYSGNGSFLVIRKNGFDWQIFTEIQGRGVFQNIFLDGNTFSNSHSVEKKNFVWERSAGLIVSSGHFKNPLFISFILIWRSQEFLLQKGNNSFGSATIGFQY